MTRAGGQVESPRAVKLDLSTHCGRPFGTEIVSGRPYPGAK